MTASHEFGRCVVTGLAGSGGLEAGGIGDVQLQSTRASMPRRWAGFGRLDLGWAPGLIVSGSMILGSIDTISWTGFRGW